MGRGWLLSSCIFPSAPRGRAVKGFEPAFLCGFARRSAMLHIEITDEALARTRRMMANARSDEVAYVVKYKPKP